MTVAIDNTHLQRLIRLRYMMVAGQLVTILIAEFGLGLALPLPPMLGLTLALALFNAATHLRLRHGGPVSQREFTAQLMVDVAQLGLLLYLSGGYANPFIYMLLPPLAIAAAAVSGLYTAIVAAAAIVCYSALLVVYVPLPEPDRLALITPEILRQTGMWLCFVVAAGVIAFFVLHTRLTLGTKDQVIAEARERAMRNEHLAVVGGLAAGTAHELGTPLATITFLAEELRADAKDPEQRDQLDALHRQVMRCGEAISQLAASAGELRASSGHASDPTTWLEQSVDHWRRVYPQSRISLHIDEQLPTLRLLLDRALEQAVASLISNAVRVSAEIEITAWWDHSHLALEVLDAGPGIPEKLAPMVGREPLGRREGVSGMGLGLYLATETIERFGGRLELSPREQGGTRARLLLPLDQLKLDDETHERDGIPTPAH